MPGGFTGTAVYTRTVVIREKETQVPDLIY